jgi:hypothetical protein
MDERANQHRAERPSYAHPRLVAVPNREDAYSTLVHDGEYEVAFASADRFEMWRRPVWSLLFVMLNGDAVGRPILGFLNVPPKDRRPTPGWAFSCMYTVATGRRPPHGLARWNPERFLAGCAFNARVRVVKRDSNGAPRPESASYSRVQALLKLTAGCPPCVRELSR